MLSIGSQIEYDRQLSHLPEAVSWAKDNAKLFLPLDRDGAVALQKIYSYPEYRLTEKDIAKQKTNADAFLVAMAVSIHGCVVTNESANKLNSTRIPNICNRFNVSCINLHDFLLILKDESRK